MSIMKKFEMLIIKLVERTGLFKQEIEELVQEKQAKVKRKLTKERLLLMLAKDLGVTLVI